MDFCNLWRTDSGHHLRNLPVFYAAAKQDLNGLNVPVGSRILRPAKVTISNVYWWKVLGEKVIESPLDDYVYNKDDISAEKGGSVVRMMYWKEIESL